MVKIFDLLSLRCSFDLLQTSPVVVIGSAHFCKKVNSTEMDFHVYLV